MASVKSALSYASANFAESVQDLASFIRFESIGTDTKYKRQTAACAGWLAKHLKQIGLEHVQVFATKNHPVVYADWIRYPSKPTLILYGHYDVQPVEPIQEWVRAPFKPIVSGNYIYGRGASDDKGQLLAHVKALEAFLKTQRQLPVNVKCVFEGEEEMGSPNLQNFLHTHRDLLKADVAVLSDMAIMAKDKPSLTYALRGSLSVELEVRGQGVDLHSGNFGGAVHNPLQVLCELLAKLHDASGKIAIPGFYASVKDYEQQERAYMARYGPTDKEILQNARAAKGWGEEEFTAYERTTIRPSLSINGIVGGYQGQGVKSVIPSKASAKLNFRIVPNQDPYVVEKLFRQYIKKLTPATVTTHVHANLHARSYEIGVRHPVLQAGKLAYARGFGVAPVLTRIGGTIPVLSLFEEELNIPSVLLGFGLPDDRIHAPNERFYLPNFLKGIHTCIWFMAALSKYKLSAKKTGKAAVVSEP
ncbi:dipeptidase [Pontibacter saemangeumensis]|uniref:Dipeptidase n=1 Tax=Pontibacter saemangeumensis TaxID=1084525 RepID=A0ABP8LUE2_9BACT